MDITAVAGQRAGDALQGHEISANQSVFGGEGLKQPTLVTDAGILLARATASQQTDVFLSV